MAELPPLQWEGFDPPFYTQVPDALFDVLLPHLSDPELRVLLYIIRRTFGFKKQADDISTSQITNGIVKRDGERLDWGAGVGKTAAIKALRGLEERGIILSQQNTSKERGFEAKTYTLRMKGVPLFTARTSPVHETDKGGVSDVQALVHETDTQETVVTINREQEKRAKTVEEIIEERLALEARAEQISKQLRGRKR